MIAARIACGHGWAWAWAAQHSLPPFGGHDGNPLGMLTLGIESCHAT
jgi:hypothetical protein